jgi:hypothetical protein
MVDRFLLTVFRKLFQRSSFKKNNYFKKICKICVFMVKIGIEYWRSDPDRFDWSGF